METTLNIINYLLQEIESEMAYNQEYEKHKQSTIKRLEDQDFKNARWEFYNYMPRGYQREPRKSVIKQNAMQIRRLLLKLYESN